MILLRLELNKREPVYIQVVQFFKSEIASGKLKSGEVIPSRRELASELKINPNTVQRAYKEMEAMGLIETKGNLPSQITENTAIIEQVRDELITDAIDKMLATMSQLDMSLEEIIPLLKAKNEEASE